jgi:predicted nucleic acid-binding protein
LEEHKDDNAGDSGPTPRRSSFLGELVLDASVILNWLIDEEIDPATAYLATSISQYEVFVPPIWNLEVRDGSLMAERRSRITEDRLQERLQDLIKLPINSDTDSNLEDAFTLARTHRLSFYDATYLKLAMRRDIPLATLDNALDRAATAEGLPALL